VSVAADAVKRSKTLAYHTVSGDTTKPPLSIPGCHDEIQAMTAMKLFAWKRIAVNPLDTFILGMTKHQTIVQCKVTLAFYRVLQFQCLQESNNLKHNAYN
jgi:hypothetical protein